MRRWLLLAFLATIAVDWPQLPFNARLTDIFFIAAAVAILARASWSGLTRLDLAITAYLAGSAIAVLFSTAPGAGAIELVRQGYVVAIYIVIAEAVRQGFAPAIATGMALSGAWLAALGLVAVVVYYLTGVHAAAISPVMTLPYLGDTLRLRALTTSEAMLACLIAVTLPFVLLHPAVAARRRIAGLGMALAAAMTFSHSLAGVAVAAVTATWHRLRPPARSLTIAGAAVVVLAFNFAAAVSIRSIGESPLRDSTVHHYAVGSGRAQIAGLTIDYQTMSYWRLKELAWATFLARPLTGVGLDRFHEVSEGAYLRGSLTEAYRTIDPHSTLPGRLAETGLVGGITLLALWLVIALECRRLLAGHASWIGVAAVAGLLGTLINSVNADVMNFRFAWVALGLVAGLNDLDQLRPGGQGAAGTALDVGAMPRHQDHQPPEFPPVRVSPR